VQIVIQPGHFIFGRQSYIIRRNSCANVDQHRYVDLAKAYSVMLGNLYKTLYNISMRRRAEGEGSDVRAVLEKRERSDVRQDESLLTRLERDLLKEWETKQRRLTVMELRVEETVFVLRDFRACGIQDEY